MAYRGDLGMGQQLTIENQGAQTFITLTSSSGGQQQSQRSSFETGEWASPPTLFRMPLGYVLRIESTQKQTFFHLQAGQMQVLPTAPTLVDAEVLPLQSVTAATPSKTMQPMQPLPPMQMGNMQMQMEPMEMRMGDMQMRMGSLSEKQTQKQFCSQCGSSVKATDRFCSSCGHQLEH